MLSGARTVRSQKLTRGKRKQKPTAAVRISPVARRVKTKEVQEF